MQVPKPCKGILDFIPRSNGKSSAFSEQGSGMIICIFKKELRGPPCRWGGSGEMPALSSGSAEG